MYNKQSAEQVLNKMSVYLCMVFSMDALHQIVKYKKTCVDSSKHLLRLTDAICRACTCESVRHALLNFSYMLAYISHLLTENGFTQIMTDISSHLLTEIYFSQIITDIS